MYFLKKVTSRNTSLSKKGPQGSIKIALKYDKVTKKGAITEIARMGQQSIRRYSAASTMPKVLNGLGVQIYTSHGVMTNKRSEKNECRWRSIMLRILSNNPTTHD